jgi:hypothetical protein|tara:strand:- start:323 stop:430 length:108 start_codon:yes stop_codon:yes gene_type:complete
MTGQTSIVKGEFALIFGGILGGVNENHSQIGIILI